MASFHLPFWIYVLTEAKGKFFPCTETGAQPQLWSCLYSQLSVGDPALFLHALTCARLFRSHALSPSTSSRRELRAVPMRELAPPPLQMISSRVEAS